MRCGRIFLASIAILSIVPSLISAPLPAHAGGFVGTAQTDFTQVTPANAILYNVLQQTASNQGPNLKALGGALTARVDVQSLVKQALGTSSGDLASAELALNQVVGSLQKIFNGELGLAVLPVSITPTSHGHVAPGITVHLLLDAGLQSGTPAGQLGSELSLLGPSIVTQSPSYRNLSVVKLDLTSLTKTVSDAAAGSGQSAPNSGSMQSAVSSVFYGAVAGNDAVLASDLPTLKLAIDTYFGVAPSIAGVYDFRQTVGTLPADRFFTSYVHLDTEQWRPLVQHALASDPSTKSLAASLPKTPGTTSAAYSMTAEPDGLLTTSSPRVSVGSLATATGLAATSVTEPDFLPANTLAFFGMHDPGTIIRELVIGAYAGAMAAQKNPHLQFGDLNIPQILANGDQIVKKIDGQIGINLDDQVFSWMHGDASVALLPVGSKDFGTDSPTTTLSVVATLRVTDPATVQADLSAIKAALMLIPDSGVKGLDFVQVPASAGNPLRMLIATPTGIGYTFYNGYLVVATALPADFSSIMKASAGNSLALSPTYKTAFAYFPTRPYGAATYMNLTGLREMIEKIAKASGADMHDYNSQVRPLLLSFKSLSSVSFAGPNGGGAQFIGISR
jgi:hypothetical protein